VVSNLTEALVEAGHEVTLFASGEIPGRQRVDSACQILADTTMQDQLAHHFVCLRKFEQRDQRGCPSWQSPLANKVTSCPA